jgi:hypothetical protein
MGPGARSQALAWPGRRRLLLSIQNFKQPRPSLRAPAKQSIKQQKGKQEWIASSLELLAMTSTCESAISRRDSPEVCQQFPPSENRGRRECRAPDAPAAACAMAESKKRTRQSGHTGITRHSPRNGFNGFLRALPGDRAFLPPSSAKIAFRELDASVGASGPHDFSVRKSALSSLAPPASTASRPASVTIANRPSVGQDGWGYKVIWDFGKSEYFCKRGWTPGPMNCPDDLPVRQQIAGWVERFAKPIAVVRTINVIAELHPAIHLLAKTDRYAGHLGRVLINRA